MTSDLGALFLGGVPVILVADMDRSQRWAANRPITWSSSACFCRSRFRAMIAKIDQSVTVNETSPPHVHTAIAERQPVRQYLRVAVRGGHRVKYSARWLHIARDRIQHDHANDSGDDSRRSRPCRHPRQAPSGAQPGPAANDRDQRAPNVMLLTSPEYNLRAGDRQAHLLDECVRRQTEHR